MRTWKHLFGTNSSVGVSFSVLLFLFLCCPKSFVNLLFASIEKWEGRRERVKMLVRCIVIVHNVNFFFLLENGILLLLFCFVVVVVVVVVVACFKVLKT